jgi:hypothetical protein
VVIVATTTRTSPGSESEARAPFVRRWLEDEPGVGSPDDFDGFIDNLVATLAEPIVASAAWTLEAGHGAWEELTPPHAAELAIWKDLRPSEATQLMELLGEAKDRAIERCKEIILEELAGVVVAFGDRHPEAPRQTAG